MGHWREIWIEWRRSGGGVAEAVRVYPLAFAQRKAVTMQQHSKESERGRRKAGKGHRAGTIAGRAGRKAVRKKTIPFAGGGQQVAEAGMAQSFALPLPTPTIRSIFRCRKMILDS